MTAWVRATALGAALALGACAGVSAPNLPLVGARAGPCAEGAVRADAAFPMAGGQACERRGEASFAFAITPERDPINPSPWYAVRISADEPAEVTLRLDYELHPHRYRPWISRSDGGWRRVPREATEVTREGARALITVDLPPGETIIAGHPLYGPQRYDAQLSRLARTPGVAREVIGQSIEGRPLTALISRASDPNAPWLAALGRQHPPEIPGAFAMEGFLDGVFAPDSYATGFRRAVNVIAVPFMNPDGVEAGHWRHNAGDVDLNRDWGAFTQPETRAVRDRLASLGASASPNLVIIDFHATRSDRVYAPEPDRLDADDQAFNAAFRAQLAAGGARVAADWRETHSASGKSAKSHATNAWSAFAVTHEMGDDTTPAEATRDGAIAAQAVMRAFEMTAAR